MKEYLVGLFLDPMGTMGMTVDEEVDYIKMMLKGWFPNTKLEYKDGMVHPSEASTVDIYIIDFGGLLPGCPGLIEPTYRELLKSIQECPNVLFIIWTVMTALYYKDEIEYRFGEEKEFGNVIFKDRGYDKTDMFLKEFKQWVGEEE